MSGRYSASRPAGREHIPLYPKGFIGLRIVQLVIAVIVLGLDAFTLSILAFDGNALMAFTAVATMAITIYCMVVHFSRDAWKGYNYWAVLALDIFALVFWLISFALLAAEVAPYSDGISFCDYYYGSDSCTAYDAVFASLAAVAGLGGVEFVLFIISLAIHSVALHRHRSAGLHCNASPTGFNGDIPSSHDNIPMGGPMPQEKQQPTPSYSAAPVQQPQHQPQYQQQQPQQHHHQQHQQQYNVSSVATPTPPPSGVYQPPNIASPQPFYPQQQAQGQQVSPVGGPVPAPHPGSYEAQGQPVTYQQH